MHHTIATEGIQKAYFHYDKMGKYGICERPRRKPAGVHRVDEWGNVQNQKQLDMNFSGLDRTVNYTGHDYDEVLEKYFAQARLYDPSTRRFLSPDPLGQGGNLYIYCKDNPLAFTDPGGLSPVKIREYVNKYSYQYYTNVGWNTSSRTSTFTIGSKTLSSTANGSNGAGINIWNQNDYLMAQDYELDRYFFYVASTPSSNTTPTISPSPPASPQVAQNTNNQNLYTPSYTDIIAIAGAGGYFSSPGCTIGNDYTYATNSPLSFIDSFGLAAVQLRQWFNEKLNYIQSAYKNASGSLYWTNSTKTATVQMSANGYSASAAFTAGKDGSYIDSNSIMWVKEGLLWQTFGDVIDPPLDHHPVRDAVVAGVVIGTAVSAPSLIKSVAPYAAPIVDKLKEGASYVLDKAYAVVDYIGNKITAGGSTSLAANQVSKMLSNVLPNTTSHIMKAKHAWDLVGANDWSSVSNVINTVLTLNVHFEKMTKT